MSTKLNAVFGYSVVKYVAWPWWEPASFQPSRRFWARTFVVLSHMAQPFGGKDVHVDDPTVTYVLEARPADGM